MDKTRETLIKELNQCSLWFEQVSTLCGVIASKTEENETLAAAKLAYLLQDFTDGAVRGLERRIKTLEQEDELQRRNNAQNVPKESPIQNL